MRWHDALITLECDVPLKRAFKEKCLKSLPKTKWHRFVLIRAGWRRQPDLTDSHQRNKFPSLIARLRLVSRDKFCSAPSANRRAHVGFNWVAPLMPVTQSLILHTHTHIRPNVRLVAASAGGEAPSCFISMLTSPPFYPSNPVCAASGSEIILWEKNGAITRSRSRTSQEKWSSCQTTNFIFHQMTPGSSSPISAEGPAGADGAADKDKWGDLKSFNGAVWIIFSCQCGTV